MFKVHEKYLNYTVSSSGFSTLLKDASQEQLKKLFHNGHKAVYSEEKVEDIQFDNSPEEEMPKAPEQKKSNKKQK